MDNHLIVLTFDWGSRQSCPLAPYMFVIVGEVLNYMIKQNTLANYEFKHNNIQIHNDILWDCWYFVEYFPHSY